MGDCDNWSYEMKEEYKEALPRLANFSEISMAGAFDVWGIYKTNAFTQGVYLQVPAKRRNLLESGLKHSIFESVEEG